MANLSGQFSTDTQHNERQVLRAGGGAPGQFNPGAIPSGLPTTQAGELEAMLSALNPRGGMPQLTQAMAFPGNSTGRRGKLSLGELSPSFNSFISLLRMLQRERRT